VQPPRLLEYTWMASWEQYRPSVVRIEIEPTPGGSRLSLVHRGGGYAAAAYRGLAGGWKRVLDWLAAYAERK
jgi:uncharacterized protein YndB with AHSA1/START domain